MGINDDDIEQIRNRANLIDVIGEHVPLRKSGRTWKGLCPFHHENTPSFHIDPAKQLYHCFGCGAGGDVFTFLMKTEGLDFREVVETLARKTGYTLKITSGSGIKGRLLKVAEAAAVFYQNQLNKPSGARAKKYISDRGLDVLADRYRLGFCPDWSASISELSKQGFSEAEIIKAGIGGRSRKGSVYDRFKGRLIFPITDNQGRVIAFGGRVLDSSTPKYLNSPETPLYHKGAVLYGLSQAKNDLIKADTAIVVEGYTDLLALAGAGIRNAVATLGTAFTVNHLTLLSRFAARVVLVFDGDEAGKSAAERSAEYIGRQRLPGQEVLNGLVDRLDCELVVAVLPEQLDPAELIAKYSGAAFCELVVQASPLITYIIDRIIMRHERKSSGKIAAAAEAARLISRLPSPVAQEEYMRYLAEKMDIPYSTLTQEIVKSKMKDRASKTISAKSASPEREFLKLIMRFPEKALALNDVAVEEWKEPLLRRLGIILKSPAVGKRNSINENLHKLDPELQELVSELLLDPMTVDDADEYFGEIFIKLKELSLERQINILRKQLEQTDQKSKIYDEIFAALVSL